MLARVILLLVLFALIARLFWRFVGAIVAAASGSSTPGGAGPKAPVPVKMLPCPVCGTYVVPGKAITLVRGGEPVYFCSDKCRSDYQAS